KEIEEALLAGSIDLAVHSLKDLPTELPDGLTIAAVPLRADPRDAIVGKKLQELPPGSIAGTSSLRRIAQLTRTRPDLAIQPAPALTSNPSAATSRRASSSSTRASPRPSSSRRPD